MGAQNSMETGKSNNLLIACPVCGEPSDSIKRYWMFHLMVFLWVYAWWRQGYYAACPRCMRQYIGKRLLINILPANLMWPFLILPLALVEIAMTYSRGYSAAIDKVMKDVEVEVAPVTPKRIGQPILKGVTGSFAGATIKLNRDEWIVMGRDPSACNLVLPTNDGISRVHCRIKFDSTADAFILQDTGSSYGTFLASGKRILPNMNEPLRSGDCFYLCNQQNQFEVILENY